MSYYIKSNGRITIKNEEKIEIGKTLIPATYDVGFNELANEFFLDKSENIKNPAKIYGDVKSRANRILNTFTNRSSNTGVLLAGERGSGKTQLAKIIAEIAVKELNLPVLKISSAYSGQNFNKFIQDLDCECVVLLDEFEKVFSEDNQENLLTLLDGLYNSKKLFILTCNDVHRIDKHLLNRPSRVFYFFEYKGLEKAFALEYATDTLVNQDYLKGVSTIMDIYPSVNFDMLKSIIEECNRYNEEPLEVVKVLNVRASDSNKSFYKYCMFANDKPITKWLDISSTLNPFDSNDYWQNSESLEDGALDLKGFSKTDQMTIKDSIYKNFFVRDITSFETTKGEIIYEYVRRDIKFKLILKKREFFGFDSRAF